LAANAYQDVEKEIAVKAHGHGKLKVLAPIAEAGKLDKEKAVKK